MEANTMKTIEIDDDIYAFLQSQAIPFIETEPNLVLRRLLLNKSVAPIILLKEKSETRKQHIKSQKVDLSKLIANGYLKEGQKLTFKHNKLSKPYEAQVSRSCLLYEGKRYMMSSVVRIILDQEGLAFPSRSYRGPIYWFNSDGLSVSELWEQLLFKDIC